MKRFIGILFLAASLSAHAEPVKKATVVGATSKSSTEIEKCLTKELSSIPKAHYEVLHQEMPKRAVYSSTEYRLSISGKEGDYRFFLKSWDNQRVLSLLYPGYPERKDRFLNYIIPKCT